MQIVDYTVYVAVRQFPYARKTFLFNGRKSVLAHHKNVKLCTDKARLFSLEFKTRVSLQTRERKSVLLFRGTSVAPETIEINRPAVERGVEINTYILFQR